MKFLKNIFIELSLIILLSACNLSGQINQENEAASANDFSILTPTLLDSTPFITPSPQPTLITSHPPVSPSPTPNSCIPGAGSIEKKQLATSYLPTPLEYRVYTPPCYEATADNRLPVLYLIHGYGFNDDQWQRLGIGEICDKLIFAEQIPPIIIVMPHDNNHNVHPPENQFGAAVMFDLVQEIDASYRSLPIRKYRSIGGLSRGGNWAINIGLSGWEYFGAIGAHSAPLFVTDGPSVVKAWLDEIPSEDFPEVFMDIGDHDKWIDKILQFEGILDDYNVPHEFYVFPGNHTENYWITHVEQYIRWYTKDW